MRGKNIRFIYYLVVGIIIAFILSLIIPDQPDAHNPLYDYILTVIITFIVWEGNLHIDHWLNKKFPWIKVPGKRLLIQFLVSVAFTSLATYIPMMIFNHFVCVIPHHRMGMLTTVCLSMGIVVSIIILTIEISTQFFYNWRSSLVEVEHYKTQSVQAQLQNLKNQINPHFLFNNLSVLSSLVYKNQDKAVEFINQLSKVYRYSLDSHNSQLITFEEELNFIRSYIYLLEIRFDVNIKFNINVSDKSLQKFIPPMALQILVENTIKHNEVSERLPLQVNIIATDDVLEVSNVLQLRSNKEPSSKSGLNNIKERYKFYTDKPVEIHQTKKEFTVILPLLAKL